MLTEDKADTSQGQEQANEKGVVDQGSLFKGDTHKLLDMPKPNEDALASFAVQSETLPENATQETQAPVKRGRGRPRKDSSIKQLENAAPKTEEKKNTELSPEQSAEAFTGIIFVSGVLMVGEEEAKFKGNEYGAIKSALTTYFEKTGAKDLPPSLVLALGVVPYYARIFPTFMRRETTRNFVAKAKNTITGMFKRKKKEAPENAT